MFERGTARAIAQRGGVCSTTHNCAALAPLAFERDDLQLFARGEKIGRPRVSLSFGALDDVREVRRTAVSLAREAGVSVMTVSRRLAEVA